MKQECEKNGINFHFVTAPDPMGEGGLAGDPAVRARGRAAASSRRYGKQTAFFSTNCGMQEPLIKSILAERRLRSRAVLPEPDRTAIPPRSASSIPPDKAGDMAFINAENRGVSPSTEHDRALRDLARCAESMVAIRAMTNLLVDAVDSTVDYKDSRGRSATIGPKRRGRPSTLARYDADQGNQYLIVVDQHHLLSAGCLLRGPRRPDHASGRHPGPMTDAILDLAQHREGLRAATASSRACRSRCGPGRSTRSSARTARASPRS